MLSFNSFKTTFPLPIGSSFDAIKSIGFSYEVKASLTFSSPIMAGEPGEIEITAFMS